MHLRIARKKIGGTFVLNNGTTDDKPIIDSTLGWRRIV